MMASMFSAGAALLLAASASAQTTAPPSLPDYRMRVVRMAAAEAAREDAIAYLDAERHRSRVVSASSDARPAPRPARYDMVLASR